MPKPIETPVLIVGAGPVGLALACELGTRRVPCVIVEQGDGTIDHPKASAINARSMELMRRWGIADAVREASTPEGFPHTALYCTTLKGFEIARIERPHHGGSKPTATSPERAQRCNQLFLDPILAARARSFGSVDIRYGWRLESFEQDESGVTATVRDLIHEETCTVRSRRLIDCSGGNSIVRRALGIALSGSDHVGYHTTILVRAPELWRHHDKGKAALISFVDARGIWRNLILLDSGSLYRLGLQGKHFYDNPEAIDASAMFREVVGGDVPHEIVSVRRWTARNVVADGYQVGRVHLAGDAAHLNHPASGIGLNTGLGDAADLGWKLAAEHDGWAGARLVDSYEAERRPVGLRNVGNADATHADDRTRGSHPAITEDSVEGARAREAMGRAIMARQRERVITDGLALGYTYASPIVAREAGPPPPQDISTYRPTTYPGSRAPHAFMKDGRSTLDLFGTEFVLMRFGSDDTADFASAFAARRVPLQVLDIAEPEIATPYERRLVLVRPDGHVAWRGNDPPSDPLAIVDMVCGA
jgi:2-polyprenyl-6-methoxyphenol hydroxylase-like FAD-dependent oxidoreductase